MSDIDDEDDKKLASKLLLRAIDLAAEVAICRKLKRHRSKGESLSGRAMAKWLHATLPSRRSVVLHEAAVASSDHRHNLLLHVARMVRYLGAELRKATRGRGRPSKAAAPSPLRHGQGMLKSVANIVPTVRIGDPQPFLFGMKLKLYARRLHLADGPSMDDALRQLARDPDIHRDQRTEEGLTAALDRLVRTRQVAKHPRALERFGCSPSALAKRFERSRQRSPFVLKITKE
jgi:hypothetical protein